MRKLVILFCGIVFACSVFGQAPLKVWVDTDVMIGKARRDVDDGLALMVMFNNPALDIRGISVTHGYETDYSKDVTEKLMRWYSPDMNLEIYRGAETKEDFGKELPAIKAMKEALEKEKMTVFVLGPATNVATLLHLYPELESQIDELVFCMGRTPGLPFSPGKEKFKFSDYNFELDIASMEKLLATKIPITLAGYEPASDIFFTKAEMKAHFLGRNAEGDKWVYQQVKTWIHLWKMFFGAGKKGFIPFDIMTIGIYLDPANFEVYEDIPVQINIKDSDTKSIIKTDQKPYLEVSYDFEPKRTVRYVHTTLPAYKDYILKNW